MQNQQKNDHASKLFAGFAAQYKAREEAIVATRAAFTRDDAYDLPFAQKEVNLIHDLLGGSLFTKNKATEQNFKENAPFYRILHFAMHDCMQHDRTDHINLENVDPTTPSVSVDKKRKRSHRLTEKRAFIQGNRSKYRHFDGFSKTIHPYYL